VSGFSRTVPADEAKGLVEVFGGREKIAERIAFVKNNRHLIPQGDPDRMEEMQERMKPFGDKMKRLAEYLRLAKA
jgi:hypothetical protein